MAEPPADGGRRETFCEVFDRHFDYVWASLRRLGVQPRDLEDVAQEVFLRVHRRFDDHDPTRPVRPWLFAFAVRCASEWRRLARHRHEVIGEHAEPVDARPRADDSLASAEDANLVMRALECIDTDRRPIFILYEIDGYTMKEIVATIGIPLATGYSRLRVAREEFTVAVRRLRGTRKP